MAGVSRVLAIYPHPFAGACRRSDAGMGGPGGRSGGSTALVRLVAPALPVAPACPASLACPGILPCVRHHIAKL